MWCGSWMGVVGNGVFVDGGIWGMGVFVDVDLWGMDGRRVGRIEIPQTKTNMDTHEKS